MRYTSVTAAAVHALHHTIVGNRVTMYNELRAWANDLQRRIKEAIDGTILAVDSVLQMVDYKIAQYNEKIEEPLKR
eukprot:3089175-Lingulodinium_polyedra.AAC.1